MMSQIGRPAVGPRVTFNLSERQRDALEVMAGSNRSEWIRDAIEQRIRRDALAVTLVYAQDRGLSEEDIVSDSYVDLLVVEGGGSEDDPSSDVTLLANGAERWDAQIEVQQSDEQEPYDDALAAAGWLIVSEDRGQQWVIRA